MSFHSAIDHSRSRLVPFVNAGLILAMVSVCASSFADEKTTDFAREVQPFLERHCVKCHGPETQEAAMRIDDLHADFGNTRSAESWTEILDRLNRGEMPPEDEPRPDIAQQQIVTDWITKQLQEATARRQRTGGHVVLRRLNRAQYNNTIRDLVGVDFQPAESFPEDPPAFGFDNIGSALNLSPLHIEKYMEAAREIVSRAQLTGARPVPLKWHFEVEVPAMAGKEQRLFRRDARGKQRQYARVFAGNNSARGGFAVARYTNWDRYVGIRAFEVHRPGRFLIRIRAASSIPTRDEVVTAAMALHDKSIEERMRNSNSEQNRARIRARWKSGGRENVQNHYETDPMYDYGPPRMQTFVNGTKPLPVVDVSVGEEHAEVFEFPIYLESTKCDIKINNDYKVPDVVTNSWHLRDPAFPRPELLVDWIEVEGPLDGEWPPKSREMVLRRFPATDKDRARKIVATFMRRAYRRPPLSDEVDKMMELYASARRKTTSLETALEVPLVAVLTSPHFLYLVEGKSEDELRLNDYELASRLAYWLWNTMPDDTLFGLAKQGRLADRDVLLDQVDRMLADPKVGDFVHSFATQWLHIRDISAVLPDKRLYPRFDEHLLGSMTAETVSFFRELLDNDLPVTNFLQSDFAMLNQRMARHYGLPSIDGDSFRRVNLPSDSHRGGILTHASIQMVTSNGTRTSPVKRGVWILGNILGDPPPPPPPNAGDIKPGVPGIDKATVRDRLEAHRNNVACASCHNKIDPLGFALENYDAIGRWRDREGFGYNGRVDENDPLINTSGRLPDGQSFENLHGLQKVLLGRKEQFCECLIEKMMIYALGRALEFTDQPTIEQIVNRMPEHGYALRGIIKDIATSDAFLTKTREPQP